MNWPTVIPQNWFPLTVPATPMVPLFSASMPADPLTKPEAPTVMLVLPMLWPLKMPVPNPPATWPSTATDTVWPMTLMPPPNEPVTLPTAPTVTVTVTALDAVLWMPVPPETWPSTTMLPALAKETPWPEEAVTFAPCVTVRSKTPLLVVFWMPAAPDTAPSTVTMALWASLMPVDANPLTDPDEPTCRFSVAIPVLEESRPKMPPVRLPLMV